MCLRFSKILEPQEEQTQQPFKLNPVCCNMAIQLGLTKVNTAAKLSSNEETYAALTLLMSCRELRFDGANGVWGSSSWKMHSGAISF